jgi:hypothetical protein
MKINITKKQYESLAKAVYLGNWMANAVRTGRPGDLRLPEYEEIADYIYSLAPQFGLPEHFESELEFSDDEMTETTEVSRLHEEYDEVSFWDELSSRLGEKDFFLKYSEDVIEKMDNGEHFIKMQECIIEWENELEKNGIERLGVVEK